MHSEVAGAFHSGMRETTVVRHEKHGWKQAEIIQRV